mmetsp:Transcript_11046/g.41190  ORF Transcript_11046/g.41190 Transcript_11046/m.41190 type:complete len:116 (-) Transcript_11046:5039-5386(-)
MNPNCANFSPLPNAPYSTPQYPNAQSLSQTLHASPCDHHQSVTPDCPASSHTQSEQQTNFSFVQNAPDILSVSSEQNPEMEDDDDSPLESQFNCLMIDLLALEARLRIEIAREEK